MPGTDSGRGTQRRWKSWVNGFRWGDSREGGPSEEVTLPQRPAWEAVPAEGTARVQSREGLGRFQYRKER